jgi:hypothetical protein
MLALPVRVLKLVRMATMASDTTKTNGQVKKMRTRKRQSVAGAEAPLSLVCQKAFDRGANFSLPDRILLSPSFVSLPVTRN